MFDITGNEQRISELEAEVSSYVPEYDFFKIIIF